MKPLIPNKSLGQNFLTDTSYIFKIVDSFSAVAADTIIEIGPGMGALTELLISRFPVLHAVELDKRAVDYLNNKFPKHIFPGFHLHKQSFLDFNFANLNCDGKAKVIGNIPYNISSEILFKLIENRPFVASAQLMVQREVANRFIAKPDNKDYGITTVALNLCATVTKLFDVPPEAFVPSPKVYSSVINILFDRQIADEEFHSVMNIVRTLFNHRRKQIINTIPPVLMLYLGNNATKFIDYYMAKKPKFFQLRPENLKSDDFIELYNHMKNFY